MLRRVLTALAIAALVLAALLPASGIAAPKLAPPMEMGMAVTLAQMGPGGAINPEKDCQTIRRCQFQRGGSYRGCISAYACRRCDFVASRCTISGRERVCRQLQCTW